MSKIKELNTGKANLLAVIVPKDSHSFEIQENPVEGGDHVMMLLGNPDYDCVYSPNLPKGNWRILGLSTQVTEKQWREVVASCIIRFDIPTRYTGYLDSKRWTNYQSEDQYADSLHTAKESGLSLLNANQCYSVNPYQIFVIMNGEEGKSESWHKAEENTGNWLLLMQI